MHPTIAQPTGLLRRFNPFSHRQHIKTLRECQHGVQNRRGQGLCSNGVNKAAIDFQVVNGKAFQINQRAMTGAKIINGNFKTCGMKPFKSFVASC